MRLIDGDLLFKRVSHEMDPGKMYLPIDFQEMITRHPTVNMPDNETIWTAHLIPDTDRERHWHCSNCETAFSLAAKTYKYCPVCGFKLVGGNNYANRWLPD